MTYYCALCGRRTVPAVMLAGSAVGPKCAAKAGLIRLARAGKGSITLAGNGKRNPPKPDPLTLDLFA